jgi:hypothetical protein
MELWWYYRYEIWAIPKTQEVRIESEGIKFLKSIGICTRSTYIKEELNILNLNASIVQSRSQLKYHLQQMGHRWILKAILTCNPKRKRKIGCLQLKWRYQHAL